MAFYAWSLFYVISAIMSTLISLNLFLKNRESLIHQKFLVYAIVSSVYLIIGAYVINAPSEEVAIYAAQIASSVYYINLGLFAYLIKSFTITTQDDKSWIILMGPMFIVPLSILSPREAFLTDFGWVVKGKSTIRLDDLFILLFLIVYFVYIGMNIYILIRKAKMPLLKLKYFVLFGSFLIQFLTVFLLNALMVLLELKNVPHISGLLYFSSLICMWYALKIKTPKEIGITRKIEDISQKTIEGTSNISKSYKRFLDKFLQVVTTDELGLNTVDFLEYLDRTRLSDVITYDKLRIIMKAESLENVDNIQALDRTIEYLENKAWGYKLAQPFIGVMESVFQSVRNDVEKTEAFDSVLINHQDFLKSSDIIYGLMGGQFLELMQPDSSLCKLPEWTTVARFYARLLLPLRHFINGPIRGEFLLKMRSMDVTRFMEMSEDGDIEIEPILKYVESLPEKRRVEAVREGFNMLIVWTMQRLAESDPSAYADYLRTIRRVTKLNAEAKGIWRAYFSLVDRATKELGRARIRDLVLSEGYSYADLEAFSSPLGLSHDALVRNIVTLEYDPRYPYEHYVSSAMREVLANTERCVLFTRLGSRVLEVAKDLGDVELKVMTTIGTIEEGIPFNDTSKLLDIVGRELESELATWIVFDNISDLVLAVGFDEAYVFARRVIDLVSSKGASLLLLMNKGAHSTEVMRTFEGLSTRIVEAAERLRLIR